MLIHIEYGTQVRAASNRAREEINIQGEPSLADLLSQLKQSQPEILHSWLDDAGRPKPGLLVFVNDESPHDVAATRLKQGDRVALMTLVSGG